MNGRDMLQELTTSRSVAAANGVRGFAAVVGESGPVDVAHAADPWQRKISCDPQACTA